MAGNNLFCKIRPMPHGAQNGPSLSCLSSCKHVKKESPSHHIPKAPSSSCTAHPTGCSPKIYNTPLLHDVASHHSQVSSHIPTPAGANHPHPPSLELYLCLFSNLGWVQDVTLEISTARNFRWMEAGSELKINKPGKLMGKKSKHLVQETR